MSTAKKIKDTSNIVFLSPDEIEEPLHAIRTTADEDKLKELISSIKRYGLIHPLVVFKKGKKYEIFAGHRRYLACRHLKMERIPCYVRSASETERDFMKLEENIVREDINVVDQARYLRYMIEKYGFTHEELAKHLGVSRPTVSNILRTLNFPDYVKQALEQGLITWNVASTLVAIDDPVVLKMYIEYAVKDGLTQERARDWVKQYYSQKERETTRVAPPTKQEEKKTVDIPKPKCYFCGLTSEDVPLEFIHICARCRIDIQEIIQKNVSK